MIPFRHESATAELRQHKTDPNTYTLLRVYSVHRSQGHASVLMRKICAWADERGWVLWLEAGQYGDSHGLSNQQLEDWYARFGFVSLPEPSKRKYTMMIRNPKEASQEIHAL